ncbi:MAG TPA: hypothetical protein DHV89_06275 [Ruminococcus sp.]|nr:hypothetical protein [Ruminococcus sp.]
MSSICAIFGNDIAIIDRHEFYNIRIFAFCFRNNQQTTLLMYQQMIKYYNISYVFCFDVRTASHARKYGGKPYLPRFPIFLFLEFVITKYHPDGNAFAERPFFAKYWVYVASGEVL